MACDTVAGWQVVLANGDIVEANANQNADLWQVRVQNSHLPTHILTLHRL
jgi:FAD/FMN-containing dehydrogenase